MSLKGEYYYVLPPSVPKAELVQHPSWSFDNCYYPLPPHHQVFKLESSQLVKTEEKEHALFSVPWEESPMQRTYLVFPKWKQLIVKPYICLHHRQTRHAWSTFAGQAVSPRKPSRLSSTSVPEGEWTYNWFLRQTKNGLDVAARYVFSCIWPQL